ncbi:MAG: hypothetical protein NC321_02505 [Clostridium sp.]|nr:hypothetical protein [Clostridium sp.]
MTLLMRDQENMEKGIARGKIYGAIAMCRDLEILDTEIIERLREKFHLSHEEAAQYMLDADNNI